MRHHLCSHLCQLISDLKISLVWGGIGIFGALSTNQVAKISLEGSLVVDGMVQTKGLMTINFIYQSLTERWHQRFENLSFVLAHVKRSDELNFSFILVLLHCNDNLVIKRNHAPTYTPHSPKTNIIKNLEHFLMSKDFPPLRRFTVL